MYSPNLSFSSSSLAKCQCHYTVCCQSMLLQLFPLLCFSVSVACIYFQNLPWYCSITILLQNRSTVTVTFDNANFIFLLFIIYYIYFLYLAHVPHNISVQIFKQDVCRYDSCVSWVSTSRGPSLCTFISE